MFFIGSGNSSVLSVVDSLATDENSFDFSASGSFVNVDASIANPSVAPLPGSRISLLVNFTVLQTSDCQENRGRFESNETKGRFLRFYS